MAVVSGLVVLGLLGGVIFLLMRARDRQLQPDAESVAGRGLVREISAPYTISEGPVRPRNPYAGSIASTVALDDNDHVRYTPPPSPPREYR